MTVNASIPTGILGTAVDAAAEILSTKVSTITGSVASQNVSILELVAEADAAHRTLRTSVIDAAATVWAAAQDGGRGTREQRARVHGLIHYASRVARETISQLYSRSSRVAFFRGHPLERALRDIHAVSYGLEPLRLFQHSAGLVRLDHPPEAPGF